MTELLDVEMLATDDSDIDTQPVRMTPTISQEGCPGYRITWLATGKVSYLYLNAGVRDHATMAEDDDQTPCIFVYEGTEFDPANDGALHFYSLEEPT